MGVITTGTGDSTGGVLTTKGDLATSTGSKIVRHGVGSNGQVLMADSTQSDGVKWAAGAVPQVVQMKQNGTAASTITMDQAPASGHSLILFVNGFNTGTSTAVSSTNTTWTKVKNWTGGGGSYYDVWIGVVSGAGGTVITVTHPNSFCTMGCIEITDTLTPTLVSSSNTNTLELGNEIRKTLTGITAGHLVAVVSGNDNTNAVNVSYASASAPFVGLAISLAAVVVCYAQASGRVDGAAHTAGGNATIAVLELT